MGRRLLPEEVPHGTSAGYSWHFRWKVPCCEACRIGHRETLKRYRAVKITCRECGREGVPRGYTGRCSTCYSRLWRAKQKKKAKKT